MRAVTIRVFGSGWPLWKRKYIREKLHIRVIFITGIGVFCLQIKKMLQMTKFFKTVTQLWLLKRNRDSRKVNKLVEVANFFLKYIDDQGCFLYVCRPSPSLKHKPAASEDSTAEPRSDECSGGSLGGSSASGSSGFGSLPKKRTPLLATGNEIWL